MHLRELLSDFDARKNVLLVTLIAVDGAIIGIHFIHELTPMFPGMFWNIAEEKSLGELFQYFQFLLISSMLLWLYHLLHESIYAAWGALYLYFFLDDFFQFHEYGGQAIASLLELEAALGLRGQDFGELMMSALVAGPLLLLLIRGYRLGSQTAKSASKSLVLLCGALIFFGLLVDAFHSGLVQYPKLYGAFIIVEDGGEMLTVSLTCWYVFRLQSALLKQMRLPGKFGPMNTRSEARSAYLAGSHTGKSRMMRK